MTQHLRRLHFNWLREFFSCCSFCERKTRCEDFFLKKKKYFQGNSQTDATVFLVTRFCWLHLSLRLSHHGLLHCLLFLLTGSILMSLHSIEVATEQHFLQSVLQRLVCNKEKCCRNPATKQTRSELAINDTMCQQESQAMWNSQVVPATALSRPSSSSHKCSDASSYCSVNLQVTKQPRVGICGLNNEPLYYYKGHK